MSAMCELSNEIFCLHNIHGLVLRYAHTEVTGIYELHDHLTGYWISDDPLWPLVSFLVSTMVIGFIFLISQHRGYRRHRTVYEHRDDGYFLLYKQSTDVHSRQSHVLASFLSAQSRQSYVKRSKHFPSAWEWGYKQSMFSLIPNLHSTANIACSASDDSCGMRTGNGTSQCYLIWSDIMVVTKCVLPNIGMVTLTVGV